MSKYKYVLYYADGTILDSYEEYGDDNFEGTFESYSDAEDAAIYAISCTQEGMEKLNMIGDEDYEDDEIEYEIILMEE